MTNQTINQAIIEPLLRYISEDENQDSSARLELETSVTSPLDYIESGILSEDNQIFDEAYLASDAIEAVSNGMMNESIMEDLKLIQEDSLLYSWRLLAEAIDLFYKNDQERLKKKIIQIPDHTTPAKLKPLLLHRLLNNKLPKKQQIFIEEIVLGNSHILEILEQLEEAIISELPDLFNQMALFALKELQPISEKHADIVKKWILDNSKKKAIRLDSNLEEICHTVSYLAIEETNKINISDDGQLFLFDFTPEPEKVVSPKEDDFDIKQICSELPLRYRYLGPGFWYRFIRKSLTLSK